IESLFRALKTRSRMSVFRRLRSLGYLTSYTHSAQYYTLREIPQFDELGLWRHGDVGFCRAGTLRAALVHLVENSKGGRTHREAQDLLQTRVRDELLGHVRAGRLTRKMLDDEHWLYLSADAVRAAKQWSRRQAQKKRIAVELGPLTEAMTIEVLVAVLQDSRVLTTPEQVVRRLHYQSIRVPLDHVRWVFERYGLGKKGDPDSPRSRR
ncbi:MAG: hypothetical protein ACE5HB_10415, partial [Terriglobia bacterium]